MDGHQAKSRGSNTQYKDSVRRVGMTILIAAKKGQLEAVQILVESNANIDQGLTDNGKTPLLIACEKGHTEVVQFIKTSISKAQQRRKRCLSP